MMYGFSRRDLSKNTKEFFLLVFVLICVCNGFAQNETNHWYFGKNAGLDFSNGEFAVADDSAMETPAGCTSFSDRDGNLALYSNGETVWNRNHEIMANGTGLFSDISGEQHCAIVPNPQNDNLYYIFHVRQTAQTTPEFIQKGLYYSVVDFSLNPLGEVTQKNIRLRDNMTTRIATTYDYESNTFKVITVGAIGNNANNTFFIWTVSDIGIPAEPNPQIISQELDFSSFGQLKISPDNAYIVVANAIDQRVFVFNANIPSGTIDFMKSVITYEFMAPYEPYGVEFSQDSKYIYISKNLMGAGAIDKIWVNQPPEAGEQEKWRVTNSGSLFGSLQLGRDGKIYAARYGEDFSGERTLGVIDYPERAEGNVDYREFDLLDGNSIAGLPGYPASLLRSRIVADYRCFGESQVFSVDTFRPVTSVAWDFGDGTTSSEISPEHTYAIPGTYKVQATISGRNDYPVTLYKDFIVHPLPPLEPDTVMRQCDPDNNGLEIFNLNNIKDKITSLDFPYEYTASYYHSQEDLDDDTNAIENPENYTNSTNPEVIYIKISNQLGCIRRTSFSVLAEYHSIPPIDSYAVCENSDFADGNLAGKFVLGDHKSIIRNQLGLPDSYLIFFYPTEADALTKTNELEDEYIGPATTAWIRIDDSEYDCNGIGKIELIVNDPIEIPIDARYALCQSQPVILDGGSANSSWTWKKIPTGQPSGIVISTGQFVEISATGHYSLRVSKAENGIVCVDTKDFVIVESGIVTFRDVTVQNGDIRIRVTGSSDYEFSLDNITFYGSGTEHTFTNVQPGIYTVYVKDKSDCELPINMQVVLLSFDDYFTPNGDGYNDVWKVRNVEDYFSKIRIDIYNRYGSLLYSMENNEGWNGILNGKELPSSDYWFKAELTDLQNVTATAKGHFSLVR